jgi:nuclear pore complex protein Nup210
LSSIDKNALQNDAVFIDGDKIKTSESNNLACIQAKDRTTGRIEIASCVKVSEVWILSFTYCLFGTICWQLALLG